MLKLILKLLRSLFSRKPVILTFTEEKHELSKGEQLCLRNRIAEGIY